jgi:hypothetical protein
LDDEAFLRHPLTPSAVARWAAATRARPPCGAQDAADRGTREDQAFALGQEFLEVMVVDADIDRGGEAHDARPNAVRDAVDGRAAPIAMDEGGRPTDTKGRTETADLANRPPEKLGGLSHQEIPTIQRMQDLQTRLGTMRQGNHASPASPQWGEDIFADLLGRTDSLIYHIAKDLN